MDRNEVINRDLESCVLCGDSTNLQVHHLTYRSQGGTDETNNLVTLCSSHHRQVHSGDISLRAVDDEERALEADGYEKPIWFNQFQSKPIQKAARLHNQLQRLVGSINRIFWEICKRLHLIDEEGLYRQLGFDTFKEYLESPDLQFSYQAGRKFVRVYRRMQQPLEEGIIDEDDIQEIGLEKADRISQFYESDHFDEWVQRAKTLTQDDLKREVSEAEGDRPATLAESETPMKTTCPMCGGKGWVPIKEVSSNHPPRERS